MTRNDLEATLDRLRALTEIILDPKYPSYSLRSEVLEISEIIAGAASNNPVNLSHIGDGETLTDNGLALSPTMAAMCAAEYRRTVEFIRGLNAAIRDAGQEISDRPVRVLYAGCGPYAILAVPLMSLYVATTVEFVLLDIHQASIQCAKSIIDKFGLSASVRNYEIMDAMDYRINPEEAPDIILLEIMNAALTLEPQVAVTRHLIAQAPSAIFLPSSVIISLALVNQHKEFEFFTGNNDKEVQRDRIGLGEIFCLDRDNALAWQNIKDIRLPAATVKLPATIDEKYDLHLLTRVKVYQDFVLNDYDCSLTIPKPLPVEECSNAGKKIRFHYQLGQQPRLVAEIET